MPSTLDPGDRKLLLIAGAILLLLIVATVVFAPPPDEEEGQGIPTTYSTTRSGAQAAYLLLGELGYKSERWERSPTDLPADAEGKILILAGPVDFPDKKERDALLGFVRAGGWIVYAGNFPFLFVQSGAVAPPSFTPASSALRDSFPAIAPSPFTQGAPKITMNADQSMGRLRWGASSSVRRAGRTRGGNVAPRKRAHTLVGRSHACHQLGNFKGRELAFFSGCIQAVRPGASPGETTVLWDEYFHGYRGSLWDYFEETPVPWAIFQLALVAVFVLLAFGRRSGPLYAPAAVSRLSPLEFVDTLGDLYRRASAGSAAVRVAYQRFRTQLVRRLALAPSISNLQLDAAVRERLGWKQPGFMDTLQRAEKASREENVPGSDALKIVQALEHYEVLFGLKTRPNEEKR